MKKIIQLILKKLASAILRKYEPEVIGITGSVGKTSAKEAIKAVLAPDFRVRASVGNYNNELGVPLTIIGDKSAKKSVLGWLFIILHALRLIIARDKNYPDILILEMGADKAGDISYLLSFTPLRIGIVTAVAPVHLETFGTVEKVEKEKRQIIANLGKDNFAILNYDFPLVAKMQNKTKAQVISVGTKSDCMVNIKEPAISYQNGVISGMSAKLEYKGSIVPVFLPDVLGSAHIYAASIAVAIGGIYNINLVEIATRLRGYHAPRGRTRLIPGIKKTLIIDDTYNSSPAAIEKSLEILAKISSPLYKRKIAVLGDMLELGTATAEEHRAAGCRVVTAGVDILLTVGKHAAIIAEGALSKKMSKSNIFNFTTAKEAGRALEKIIVAGDVILIKGSQEVRLEKIAKEIMAKPLRAGELLVRQGWEK